MLSKNGEIRRDEACLDYAGDSVILYPCHGSKGNQLWQYEESSGHIVHGVSDKCLTVSEGKHPRLLMEPCHYGEQRQSWTLENYDPNKFKDSR